MSVETPPYTIGVEEEYLLVDPKTRDEMETRTNWGELIESEQIQPHRVVIEDVAEQSP